METGLQADRIINNWNSKTYLDEYEKEIRNDKEFDEATIRRKDDEIIIVITKEKYIFMITAEKVSFNGIYDGKEPPALQEGNVTFKLSPDGWTNSDITVEITTKIEGYDLEYSIDGETWKKYENPIIMTDNGSVYARLVDIMGVTGESATKVIDKIDRTPPSATFSVTPENPTIFDKIIQIGTNRKDDKSGVAPSFTAFISKSPEIGVATESSVSSGAQEGSYFSNSYGIRYATTYYYHAKIRDKAGNSVEIVSDPIVISNGGFNIETRVRGYNLDVKAIFPDSVAATNVRWSCSSIVRTFSAVEGSFYVEKPGTYKVKAELPNGAFMEKIVEVPYYEEMDVFNYMTTNNIPISNWFTRSTAGGDRDGFSIGWLASR